MSFRRTLIWTVYCDRCGNNSTQVDGLDGYAPVMAQLRSGGWQLTPPHYSHLLEEVHAICPSCVQLLDSSSNEGLDSAPGADSKVPNPQIPAQHESAYAQAKREEGYPANHAAQVARRMRQG